LASFVPGGSDVVLVCQDLDDYITAFDEDQDWSYYIFDEHDAALVGSANLYRSSGPERVAIGYWVRTSRTRRGYASRAAQLLVDSAFSSLPLVQIIEIQMDRGTLPALACPRSSDSVVLPKLRERSRFRAIPAGVFSGRWTG